MNADNLIELTRFESTGDGTLSRWFLPDGWDCYTLEPPWKNNEQGESCIPAGEYALQLRESPIVERTSGGEFPEGFEVVDVEGRTYIMLHPGNHVAHTDGCIMPGRSVSRWSVEELGRVARTVTSSRDTFRELMKSLLAGEGWRIRIEWGVA